MPAFTEHSIAAGWNNVGSLTRIGLIVATSNIAFPEPAAQGGYVDGIVKVRMDQLTSLVGINHETWLMSNLTFKQYLYSRTTWCGGGFAGKVTIRTRWQEKSYANYNAILRVQSENLQTTMQGYASVTFTFYDLQVIT